ncbi:MAG: HD domain-containing protein [Eubacteriales bacterium]|nr:HD domain-containing protein [Eubacteriales bacterium]
MLKESVYQMMKSMSEIFSPAALYILREINAVEGAEAYLVGGCVRDYLLGRPFSDEDICTSLLPEETAKLFAAYPQVDKGLKHGTLGVIIDGRNYEITTYRKDGNYRDHRRPDQVEFSRSLEEDLSRRDFTINALALGQDGQVVDPFGGQTDLERGVVRAVGNPATRFEEDALRLLRAARFENRLGFSLDSATEKALRQKASLLSLIAAERIADEFLKIIDDRPEGVTRLHELGLLGYMYPELERCFLCPQETPYHLYDVGRHSVKAASLLEGRTLRLAALAHDLGKPAAKTYGKEGRAHFYDHAKLSAEIAPEFFRRLFIPQEQIRLLVSLVRWHDFLSKKPAKLAQLLREESREFFELLFPLKRADIYAQSELDRERKLRLVEEQEEVYRRLAAGPCAIKELAINGRDLIELGFQGPEIGAILREVLVFVMEKPGRNRHDYLLERVSKWHS